MDCMAGQRDESSSENLTCLECRKKTGRIDCNNLDHQNFWVHKCRYCCTPAKWFCFGNTHFCNNCHDRAGEFRNIDASQLPQCKGALHCPLGIDHPPNGEEYVLSCKLCQEEHERDPEITKQLARFEARQKVKRTLEKIFSFILHFLQWITIIVSFSYNIYIAFASSSSDWNFFSSFIDIFLKLIPFYVIIIFAYQIFFHVFRRGRIRGQLNWYFLLPYCIVFLAPSGTISFTFSIISKFILFLLFFIRTGILGSIVSLFYIGQNLKAFILVICLASFEFLRIYFSLNINSFQYISNVCAFQILAAFMIYSIISTLSRRRYGFNVCRRFFSFFS